MHYSIFYQRANGSPGYVGRRMPGDNAEDALTQWLEDNDRNPFCDYSDVKAWVVVPSEGSPTEPILYRERKTRRVEPI